MSETAAAAPAAQPNTQQTQVQKATEAAAKQAGFQEKSQAELEEMSGAELSEYFQQRKLSLTVDKPVDNSKKTPPKAEAKADPLKNAAKEAMRKFKVKVDGQEQEVDEEELKRGYSHQKAANKILQEGKAARAQAEEFLAMMRNPEKFYETARKLGHDPRKLAEDFLAKQLEDELLDPRERELRQAKAKLKEIEELDKQQKEAEKKKMHEALKAKWAKDYSDQFVAALEQTGLPATKGMVGEMAKYVSRAAKIGFQLTALEAAQLVQQDILERHQRLIGDSDGEMLIKLLGENTVNKVRAYDTNRLKNPEREMKVGPTDQGERRPSKPQGRRMTAKEWREFNRK